MAQSKDAKTDYQMEGSTSFLSHFVHRGLSQSNMDPSLQTQIFVPIGPQFRFGLWGSNVSYEGSDNHFWLKILFDLKLEFNKDADLTMSYNINQFYKNTLRNGYTTKMALSIFSYRIMYDQDTNWEGTETASKYVAFGKSFPVFGNFKWDNQLGYTMIEVENLQNYFDFRTALSSHVNKLDFEFSITATSNPGQFNGRGNFFGIISTGFKY
jgi:uncharacterized protein (TIGR02001 family)